MRVTIALVAALSLFATACQTPIELGMMAVKEARFQRSQTRANARYEAAHPRPPPPVRIESPHYSFVVPGGWVRGSASNRLYFGDAAGDHLVELIVVEAPLTPSIWLDQRFPTAHARSKMTFGGRTVNLATRTDAKYVTSAAVVAAHGAIYELTCSSKDRSAGVSDAICVDVLLSFRVKD